MDLWLGNRKRILVLNREDMISTEDRNSWAIYFANKGVKVVFSNGKLGMVHSNFILVLQLKTHVHVPTWTEGTQWTVLIFLV